MKSLHGRLDAIEKAQRREASNNRTDSWYQLRVSPTSPPSTSVYIRGGLVQQGPYWIAQETVYFPSLTLDFSSTEQFSIDIDYVTVAYPGYFSNAFWYQPVLLFYTSDYFFSFTGSPSAPPCAAYVGGTATALEFETAVEAEQELDGWYDGAHAITWGGDMPLWAVILKNNGITGSYGAVQAIDAVNRGRSYLWKDLRMRHFTDYYDGYP